MSKAEDRARDLGYWADPLNRVEYTANDVRDAFIEGYHQAEKDILSEYGWLVSKVKILKLKYCHNREAVKAIEEACDILNELDNNQK